jgi:hypothetical protein
MSNRHEAKDRVGRILIGVTLALAAASAFAHHSFSVFFDHEKSVSIHGKVTQFQFRNPHGIVGVEVANPDGSKVIWKAETNSPSMMARRGWTKDSIRVGDTVTVDGWPARDGARYLRIRELKDASGKPIGKSTDVATEMGQ